MKLKNTLLLTLLASAMTVNAQVSITIDSDKGNIAISPYMYGRNGMPKDAEEFRLIRESGIKFERMNNGNNMTKYNWRKKLTCHPDWYNNVYDCNWDEVAQNAQREIPYVQGMFGFQLLGKVAKTKDYNFNDWEYNKSKWWEGCGKKMCGGGLFNADGSVAKEGDPNLFLEDWPADSTVGIYKHWEETLGLDMSQFNYWNMDNELEIWGWTHGDVYKMPYSADTYEQIMQSYFSVAKAIRKINPDVKLCGPAAASEWTWFSSCDGQPTVDGKKYCWLEYFIMRCAEEEKATGVRMIDVFDIHNYPEDKTDADQLQSHRMFYDRDYVYPHANGVKTVNGSWDNSQNKEYIFERCKDWIIKYYGSDNGIKFGVGEYNVKSSNEMVHALAYASIIGEGSRHGMEYFTPWTWHNCMWEVVHLFSSCAKEINVQATSTDEDMVSAYASKNTAGDSLTVILINRSPDQEKATTLNFSNVKLTDGSYPTLTLEGLTNELTFKDKENNALQASLTAVTNGTANISLKPYTITAIKFATNTSSSSAINESESFVFFNKETNKVVISASSAVKEASLISANGSVCGTTMANSNIAEIDCCKLEDGVYLLTVTKDNVCETHKMLIKR